MSLESELLKAAPKSLFNEVEFRWDDSVFSEPREVPDIAAEPTHPFLVVRPCAVAELDAINRVIRGAGLDVREVLYDEDYVD